MCATWKEKKWKFILGAPPTERPVYEPSPRAVRPVYEPSPRAERAERAVRDALERAGCPAQTRVLRTSAKSRLGRDEVWRLLRCVVLPGEGIEES